MKEKATNVEEKKRLFGAFLNFMAEMKSFGDDRADELPPLDEMKYWLCHLMKAYMRGFPFEVEIGLASFFIGQSVGRFDERPLEAQATSKLCQKADEGLSGWDNPDIPATKEWLKRKVDALLLDKDFTQCVDIINLAMILHKARIDFQAMEGSPQ